MQLPRFVLALVFLGCAAFASAADTARLRVLLITGGHGFEREPFFQVFRDNPDITLTALEHSKGTADAWDRMDLNTCDVVVLYDMPKTATAAAQAKFKAIAERGIGLVVTHHALASYQGWPEYERIVGGHYNEAADKGGDLRSKPSAYEHDLELPIKVVAPGHPLVAGVKDFTLKDELYWDYRTGADIQPLLVSSHPKATAPLAWCREEGKSRVVYLLLGHGPSAFNDANYRRLLANAIRWNGRR